MGLVRPAIAAGCAVLVISIAAVAAFDDDSEDEPQRVRAAATTGATTPPTTTPPTTAPPPGSPVAGLSPAELKALVQALGTSGQAATAVPTSDQVAVPDVQGDGVGASAGRAVTVIRIPGSHPLRALDATVALDGTDVGPGLLAPDGSMVAVLTDPALARPGAEVTYRYGDGTPTAAGALTGGR